MFKALKNRTRGFTLIELLVVIAIIGILSSVVLASLSTARQKARDATRISDIKNVQLALELYYDGTQSYPKNAAAATADTAVDIDAANNTSAALVPTYIPKMPLDPQNRHYKYVATASTANPTTGCANAPCSSYSLYVSLERQDNLVLGTDADLVVTGVNNGTSDGVTGGTYLCSTTAATPGPGAQESCYDLKP